MGANPSQGSGPGSDRISVRGGADRRGDSPTAVVGVANDLTDLPGPAQYYMTPAMAMSRLRSRGVAYPISGDHTTRAVTARTYFHVTTDVSTYIELARRK